MTEYSSGNPNGRVSIYIGNYYEKVFEPIDEFDPVNPPGSVSEMNYISSFPIVGNGESAPFETIPGQSYYYVGVNRVATRTEEGEYIWIYGDHLGSTSVTADRDGEELSRRKYTAWGVTRSGTGAQATDYGYTGQMQVDDIYYYNPRWYDPAIGRFMQADTIVPLHQGTQGFDRYAYVNNNPIRYTDPTGKYLDGNTLMIPDSGNDNYLKKMSMYYLPRNYNAKEAVNYAKGLPPQPFQDQDLTKYDYFEQSIDNGGLGYSACGGSLCTVFISHVITQGGGWYPKNDIEKFYFPENECIEGKLFGQYPFIRTPDFVSFMRVQPDVTVSTSYSMDDFSPDLFSVGDIVVLSQGDMYQNHAVLVVDVSHSVEIMELSGSALPPSFIRDFKEVETQISSFIIIRIMEYYNEN